MAKRYSDAIRIRETKSAYNIQTEESNEWNNSIKPVIDGTITSIKDIILKLKIDINQL